jgi:hypothetical protein
MNTDQNLDFVSFTGLSGGNSRPPRTLWKFLLTSSSAALTNVVGIKFSRSLARQPKAS